MSITRTAIVDDDGSRTTGTVLNNAWKIELYDQLDGRWSEFSTTSTGNQDNFPYSEADVLRCNNATTITLRGLLAPAAPLKPGKPLLVVSVGAGTVVLNDQDANSTAANRLITGISAPLTLAAGTGFAALEYDSVTARWRVMASSVAVSDPLKAPLASPALTGTPTAPTAAAGTNTTQLATTAFVQAARAPRVTSVASSATPAPNADTDDLYDLTALAAAAAFTNPSGSPVNGQKLIIRIKDNATARALTWGTAYVAGGVALPSTTILSKILTLGFIYNTANALNKWQCIASAQEA